MVDQLGQLRLWKRRRVERQRVAPRVLKVALHPHGTEQEETERDGGRAFQTIGDRPGATRRGHDSPGRAPHELGRRADRKSRRLNSSHLVISYAVFCLKKKKKKKPVAQDNLN